MSDNTRTCDICGVILSESNKSTLCRGCELGTEDYEEDDDSYDF